MPKARMSIKRSEDGGMGIAAALDNAGLENGGLENDGLEVVNLHGT